MGDSYNYRVKTLGLLRKWFGFQGNHTVVVPFVVVAEKAKMLAVELCHNQLLSTIKKNQKHMDNILPACVYHVQCSLLYAVTDFIMLPWL